MEGSRLTEEQTRSIYETKTIGITDGVEKVDDIIETVNHFRCFDYILKIADKELSEDIIKHIHLLLKSGTTDSQKEWFAVGDYKKRPNVIGDMIETTHPSKVPAAIKSLLKDYRENSNITFEDIIDFHSIIDNKRADVIFQTFFKHYKSANTSISVLKWVYFFKFIMKINYILKGYIAVFPIVF